MNKNHRIKKSLEIEKLVKVRRKVANKYYVIYFNNLDKNDLSEYKVAVSVSKKVGNAVKRNYEKRIVREIVRQNAINIIRKKVLIVIKKEVLQLKFEEKKQYLEELIKKIKEK